MKFQRYVLCLLLLASIPLGMCLGQAAKPASTKTAKSVDPEARLDWIKRIDKVHEIGYEDWITAAWATMLIKQGIIPAKDASAVAGGILKMFETPDPRKLDLGRMRFWHTHWWLQKELGKVRNGNVKMARTQPSEIQQLQVRHLLMKQICRIYDLQEATLDLAEQHINTIMPGYTHFRHAQPTTFGHYLLSVFDAIQRSTTTLELGYHQMSLNELGCGALAGTSWPIDRDLVSTYLGLEGLIENANDAVGYTDGYLVVACGLTNVTNIASRTALELSFWSGVEYGFLEIGYRRGTSYMMPQKDGNPNSMEILRTRAGQMIGHLTSTAVAGLRTAHGDVFEMLYVAEPVLEAIKAAKECTSELDGEMRKMGVHKERMLAVIRESYIASTELANQMVRDYGLDYRTAHDIVNDFVLTSRKQKIPASEARAELLDEAAQKALGRKLGMAEARLRELLDPAYFIKVTNSRGGAAPDEVARMIAERRIELNKARARHLTRIEKIERAEERLISDLKEFSRKSK